MITLAIGNSGQRLIFSDHVIQHFLKHRQLRCWHREAGGQLFARITPPDIIIDDVTGPRPGDRRSRYFYGPDRKSEQQEILDRYERDLHYIGDWHTHPENIPAPSQTDMQSISETFKNSTHALNYFALVIVGRNLPPEGLSITLVGSKK